MSRTNLLKNMAKLRQFSKGGNVEAYLETELRQNLRAIEEALKGGYSYNPSASINNGSLAFCVRTASMVFSGSPTYTILDLTTDNAKAVNGSIVDDIYLPSEAGTYLIDMHLGYVSGGATSGNMTVRNKYGTVLEEVTVDGTTVQEQSRAVIADLSPTSGVFFKHLGTGLTGKFYCKIFKLS